MQDLFNRFKSLSNDQVDINQQAGEDDDIDVADTPGVYDITDMNRSCTTE